MAELTSSMALQLGTLVWSSAIPAGLQDFDICPVCPGPSGEVWADRLDAAMESITAFHPFHAQESALLWVLVGILVINEIYTYSWTFSLSIWCFCGAAVIDTMWLYNAIPAS